MIDITRFPRSMTRDDWTMVYRMLRQCGGYAIPLDVLMLRQVLAEMIEKLTDEEGEIAINVESIDCDCCLSSYSFILSSVTSLYIERRINGIYDGAEGPTRVWLSSPMVRIESQSRDLALEAFEDGHPHSISLSIH